MLLSESASAQLTLTSTTGTIANPVYHYDIDLTDTGTTNIGTFWFAWVPGQDFLPTAPLTESSPAGWASALTGSNNQLDGTAIQWIASSNAVTPGHSLGGFDFTSTDSPTMLAGKSPSHPTSNVLTTTVYSGAPFSDAGFQLTVSPATAALAQTTTTLTTSADSIQSGDSVTLTASVAAANPGGVTPTGSVTFSQGSNVLGTSQVNGGTAVFSTSSLSSGSDSVTATYGGDATYAPSASAPLVETVAAPVTLVTTIAKSTLPPALVAGSAAAGTVTVDLTNSTASTAKGKVTVELFASTDGSIDGSAVELARSVRAVNVKPTGTMAEALPVRIGAATLPASSYALIARVIDASGNNDDSAPGPTVTVAAPFVAVSETFERSTIPTTASAGSKTRALAILRITNNGNVTTSGTTTAALFASLNGAVDGTATQINAVTQHLRIRPGKSVLVTIPLKRIPAIAAGAYAVLAQVIDPNGAVSVASAGILNVTA